MDNEIDIDEIVLDIEELKEFIEDLENDMQKKIIIYLHPLKRFLSNFEKLLQVIK